jgi:hypothetical protein
VFSWGSNFLRQLGNLTQYDCDIPCPVALGPQSKAIAIAAGPYNGLCFTEKQEVICWGTWTPVSPQEGCGFNPSVVLVDPAVNLVKAAIGLSHAVFQACM